MYYEEMFDNSMNYFEKGYPKKIFYKHCTKPRIYRDPNDNIIGVYPAKLEFWIYLYNSIEEKEFNDKRKVK